MKGRTIMTGTADHVKTRVSQHVSIIQNALHQVFM